MRRTPRHGASRTAPASAPASAWASRPPLRSPMHLGPPHQPHTLRRAVLPKSKPNANTGARPTMARFRARSVTSTYFAPSVIGCETRGVELAYAVTGYGNADVHRRVPVAMRPVITVPLAVPPTMRQQTMRPRGVCVHSTRQNVGGLIQCRLPTS